MMEDSGAARIARRTGAVAAVLTALAMCAFGMTYTQGKPNGTAMAAEDHARAVASSSNAHPDQDHPGAVHPRLAQTMTQVEDRAMEHARALPAIDDGTRPLPPGDTRLLSPGCRANTDPGGLERPGRERIPVIIHLRRPPGGRALAEELTGRAAVDAMKIAHHSVAAALLRSLDAAAAAGRASEARSLWIANAVAVEAEPELVREIATRPDVRLITLDKALRPEPWSPGPVADRPTASDPDEALWNIRMIRADDVWQRLGIDGTGSVVAIVDSGVDYHHPVLRERYRGYVGVGNPSNSGNWWCKSQDKLCGRRPLYPVDGVGHGTHVTGTALAPDGVGVAPGARWIAARVCVRSDTCYPSWIMESLQWLLESEPGAIPDVVNISLSIEDSTLLYELTRALDQAGIVVVAAAGNHPQMLRSPANHPNVIAVGAVDDTGALWRRSGRGKSLSGEIKPDLVAPGLAITSTIPGGGWARNSGTSMAAPHVTGAVALLRQAKPDITPHETLEVLRRSATPLSDEVPEPGSGWGLLNIYAAVQSVMDVGQLSGHVVDADDGEPISWATVRVATSVGDPIARSEVDAKGRYSFDLAPDDYLVIAEAFTYRDAPQRDVRVERDKLTQVDFALEPDEPMGYLAGTLRDAETGVRLGGEIRLEGVPSQFTITVDKHTGFSQRLPPDTYRLRIAQFGYRVLTDTVKVTAGATSERHYVLTPAPRILLVDGDAWAYGAAVDYFRSSLDRLGYVYHEWPVVDETVGPGTPGGPPSAEEMGAYDLVIWTSSITGPTYVMGARPISAYLNDGGRLLLSGQDALCTDARTENSTDPCNEKARPDPYVRDQLHLRVVRDSAQSVVVEGRDDGPLRGLTLRLNGVDSMDNQSMPDVIAVVDDLNTTLIADYPGVGGAAALAGTCDPHRAIALGFGFEGIEGAAARDEVMGRLLTALTVPDPEKGLVALPDQPSRLQGAGGTAEYTVTLHSTGTTPDSYNVGIDSSLWGATLWDATFKEPLEGPIELGHCKSQPFGVRVAVPEGVGRGITSTTTIRVDGASGIERRLRLYTQTPSPVLVVDGDFARNTETRYLEALKHAGVPYDRWVLGLYETRPEPPPDELLARYPSVVWFTGDDWRMDGSLNVPSQRALARYLDEGGRLYFSSADYLTIRGGTPFEDERLFHEDYLGVRAFVADQGKAHDAPLGGAANSVFAGLQPCALEPRRPGEDFSDRLEPDTAFAESALLSANGQTVATQASRGLFKSLFMAFDAGQMEESCANEVMARALDWFSPMYLSKLEIANDGRRTFASGDPVRLRLDLLNNGPRAVDGIAVRWEMPEGAELDPRYTPPNWSWDEATRTLSWSGDLARNQRLIPEPEVVLQLNEDLADNLGMSSTALINAEGITVTRAAQWRVNAPDLRGSNKSVPDADRNLTRGDAARFVINVRNSGTKAAAGFVVTDTLPTGLVLIPESVFVESGDPPDLDSQPGSIIWRGSVSAGSATSMSYSARVTSYRGGWLRNRAILTDEEGESIELSASVFSRPLLLFPWAGAQIDPDP
jgi:uncharacterized repeat protein (TIGR01451 family)